MKRKVLRVHKVRIYPNEEQKEQLEKSFGVARFAWNTGLDMWNKHYRGFVDGVRNNRPSGYTIRNRFVKEIKPEFPWLSEVSSQVYANSILDMGDTWSRYFKGHSKGKPRFKSKKKARDSFTLKSIRKGSLRWIQNRLYVPKFKKDNHLKTAEFPRFNGELKQVTFSRKADKYFASCLFELDEVPSQYKLNDVRYSHIGVDVGSRTLAHTSDNLEFILPRVDKENKKIARLQRKLSRQERGSSNYLKTKTKLQRTYQRRSNRLLDGVHKTTNYLVRNYQNIAIEDLRTSNMMRNSRLANTIVQSYFYEFKRQLDYKINYMRERGVSVELFLVDPRNTTKRCSDCGQLNDPKSSKTYHCNHCLTVMDRDFNAAINIERKPSD